MSIEHMKKQSKNLLKLLPGFVSNYPEPLKLSHCQELIAKTHGYPSWHEAVTRAAVKAGSGDTTAPAPEPGLPHVTVTVESEDTLGFLYDSMGSTSTRRRKIALFGHERPEQLHAVTEELDHFQGVNGGFEDSDNEPPARYLRDLQRTCEKLVKKEPGYIDGYAHLTAALIHAGKFTEAIAVAAPVYDGLVKLLPPRFKGLIPYLHLENRPFHRLASNLVRALYNRGTDEDNLRAAAIAKQLCDWWPNDNLGMRFMLSAEAFAAQSEE